MTTLVIVLGSALGGACLLGLAVWLYVRKQLRKLMPAPSSATIGVFAGAAPVELGGSYSTDDGDGGAPAAKTALPVVQPKARCESCEHWGLEAGQKIMDANPAFRAASQWRQPWQMGQKRSRAYIELEQQIYDAEKTLGDGKATELRAQLAQTEEYPEDPDGKGLSKNLKVTWADFGLCGKHKDIRAKTDKCEHFTVRVED